MKHPLVWLIVAAVLGGVARGQQLHVRDFLPRTSDDELATLFGEVKWYDVTSKPPIFQHNGQFHSIYEDIGPGGPRNSNGNGEWPWAHPSTPRPDGLTHNLIGAKVTGYREQRVAVPLEEIVTSSYFAPRREPRGSTTALNWAFSDGTEFVELVTNRISGGDYTFKVHRMTMQSGEWVFRVYRPFLDQASYETATGTKATRVSMRVRSAHTIAAFDERKELWKVPRIEPALAKQLLLTSDFQLATDDDFIPTTDHTEQVYPRQYLGAFIGNATDQDRCRTCHKQVLMSVRRFDQGEWYGLLRGGGHDKHRVGVFSWYHDRFLARR